MKMFMNLILNEKIKIYRKKSSLLVFIALLLGVSFAAYIKNDAGDNSHSNWRKEVVQEIQVTKEALASTEGGQETELLEKKIAINEYRLEQNTPPLADDTLWGFMSYTSSFIGIVTIFAIIVAGSMISKEFNNGTIKFLLIRPHNRGMILLSKYIATLLYGLVLTAAVFIIGLLMGSIFMGFAAPEDSYLVYANNEVVERNILLHVITLYAMNSVGLIMMVTLAFMLSTAFRSTSVAIGIAIFLTMSGTISIQLLSQFDLNIGKYLLFANTNLLQYSLDGPPFAGMSMSFSLLVLAVHYLVFMVITWLSFTKRDVAV
ncbi:ABC transporter permease [Bacillus sp. V2I10]|uniref:ABC transporter permease n=1 Tax=Bacillus sp. V2I10 TaxID=3042276 RepID=UPI00278A1160|nr:DUF2705 family protein [Bacillus sp. V2I10]MDQ0861122.1 ABC-2 type transport system permease protein [Bacillus sp. V2I10]